MSDRPQPLFPVPGWSDDHTPPATSSDSAPYPTLSPGEPTAPESERSGSDPLEPDRPQPYRPPADLRKPLMMTALVMIAVLLLGTGAVFLAGRDDSPPPSSSSPFMGGEVAAENAAQTALCSDLPDIEPNGVSSTQAGLVVSTRITATCSSGNTLSTDSLRVDVTDGNRSVASGYFDLSDRSVTVRSGDVVQQDFRFPAGMYWQLPEKLSNSVTISVSNESNSSSTAASGTSRTPGVLDAVAVAQPTGSSAEAAAAAALRDIANSDRQWITREVENRWIPQLSSKKEGLVAEGITWSSSDILREHLELRQRFPQARLMWSGEWSTFSYPDWWVTAVAIPHASGQDANNWCSANRFDADHCFAKIVSTTLPIPGSTLGRK